KNEEPEQKLGHHEFDDNYGSIAFVSQRMYANMHESSNSPNKLKKCAFVYSSQQICEGACQAGCVQLQGRGPRGTGLSATDQGVDMVIA
ncbi:hypothetical protein HID58_081019, partial [Brassica napus]